jgi:hypothetical protein
MDDETGLKNCVEGLKQIIGQAEKKGVVLTDGTAQQQDRSQRLYVRQVMVGC